jgi:hypothetical protein
MYARLVSFTGVDPEKREPAVEKMKTTVIPMLQTYNGFAGYISLYDEENNRAKAIILWDSKELAETAEETLVERRAKITAEVGIQVESADLWEAPVVELVGARV